ncbi:MAG: adenylate kinase [Halobacteriovoraceae bacterium]|jgi:adenylate kinase family enzyme|nr:adenylate kinase [Halobacteriovoraceae bacterium]
MKKVVVIGTTGSGKSTFANKLAVKLSSPYIQLDKLFWKPNWQWPSEEEFFQAIRNEIDKESWIVDGNYTRTQAITWTDADTVIWIDLPFWLTFYQCFTRSFKRALSNEELWPNTGNRESFGRMFSKDSILLWLFKTYDANKKKYKDKISNPLHHHITFHNLKSRKDMEEFLSKI